MHIFVSLVSEVKSFVAHLDKWRAGKARERERERKRERKEIRERSKGEHKLCVPAKVAIKGFFSSSLSLSLSET